MITIIAREVSFGTLLAQRQGFIFDPSISDSAALYLSVSLSLLCSSRENGESRNVKITQSGVGGGGRYSEMISAQEDPKKGREAAFPRRGFFDPFVPFSAFSR
jgi:hypothetical protein